MSFLDRFKNKNVTLPAPNKESVEAQKKLVQAKSVANRSLPPTPPRKKEEKKNDNTRNLGPNYPIDRNLLDNADAIYRMCGIQDRFVEALKDQGHASRVPKSFDKQKEAFKKMWGSLSYKERETIHNHLRSLDAQTFLKTWSKLQGALAGSLR